MDLEFFLEKFLEEKKAPPQSHYFWEIAWATMRWVVKKVQSQQLEIEELNQRIATLEEKHGPLSKEEVCRTGHGIKASRKLAK